MEKSIPETDQKNNQPQQTTQENVNQEPQNQNENPVNSISTLLFKIWKNN